MATTEWLRYGYKNYLVKVRKGHGHNFKSMTCMSTEVSGVKAGCTSCPSQPPHFSNKVGTGRKSCAAELFKMNLIPVDTRLNMQHKSK